LPGQAGGLRSLAALRDDVFWENNKAARHTSNYRQWSASPLFISCSFGVIPSEARDLLAIWFINSYLYMLVPPAWPAKLNPGQAFARERYRAF
jgi:hypothetical protein